MINKSAGIIAATLLLGATDATANALAKDVIRMSLSPRTIHAEDTVRSRTHAQLIHSVNTLHVISGDMCCFRHKRLSHGIDDTRLVNPGLPRRGNEVYLFHIYALFVPGIRHFVFLVHAGSWFDF